MSFLNKIFSKKSKPIKTNNDFWNWFQENEKKFYKIVKTQKNIEKDFFDPLSLKLDELKDGFFFLTGMYDDNKAELILTSDGNIKNFVFIEQLIQSAPKIDNWIFTALKPEMDIENVSIQMAGYTFDKDNLSFYSVINDEFPDDIDIYIIHENFDDKNKNDIINGTYIFLDNFLGELNFAISIDHIKVIGKHNAKDNLIPIEKLKSYLKWRKSEFIEKYEGTRYITENDNFISLTAELKSGNKLIAIINSDLLSWDKKASHEWILAVTIKFDGKDNNGMPDDDTYQLLNAIEDRINNELKDKDGYLNIGRQTADSEREIYYACKDFRKPSKLLHEIQQEYRDDFELDFDIYKDKYWRSFDRFITD